MAVQPPPNFNIAASELDTWNAVGQLLVRMDGVIYEGRAQKLGLYAVEYRGEKFLIFTRALLLSSEIKNLTTEVRTALQNGKPNGSAPRDRAARFAAGTPAGGIDSYRIGKESCTGEEARTQKEEACEARRSRLS